MVFPSALHCKHQLFFCTLSWSRCHYSPYISYLWNISANLNYLLLKKCVASFFAKFGQSGAIKSQEAGRRCLAASAIRRCSKFLLKQMRSLRKWVVCQNRWVYQEKSILTVHSLLFFPALVIRTPSPTLTISHTHTHTHRVSNSEGPWAACPSAVAGRWTTIFPVMLGEGREGGGEAEDTIPLSPHLASRLPARGETSSRGPRRLSRLQLVRQDWD